MRGAFKDDGRKGGIGCAPRLTTNAEPQSLSEKSEFKFCKAVADLFHRAGLDAKPIRHHRQITTQFPITLFDMVSNFAAFEYCEKGIGNPSPSRGLPIPQLMNFAS